jgi:hypothetical protein
MDKKEHTELEKKMLEHIAFLLGVLNVYELYFYHYGEFMTGLYDWKNKNFTHWDKVNKVKSILDELNEEFEWNFDYQPLNRVEKDEKSE